MKKLRITIDNKSYEVTVEDLTEPATHQTAIDARANPAQASRANVSPPATPPPRPQLPIATGAVTCPMAGSVKSILVKQGDAVTAGQPLVVLEAMKMENQITAPVAGKVRQVDVNEGDQVHEEQVLLVLE